MHIGFCGPASLESLTDLVDHPINIQGYPFPGSSTLIREYIRLGHTVSLFTTSPDISQTAMFSGPRLKIYAVPTRSRGPGRGFDFFAQERASLISLIHEVKPTVLHAHWTYEFGLAARQSGIPSVVTVHDWAPSVARRNKHPYWYFRWAMQFTCLLYPGRLTAPSSYIADRVVRTFRKECRVIPNGLDLSVYGLPREPVASPKGMRVGMLNVGFSSLKNAQTAFKAWSLLTEKQISAVLIAAGPGYEHGGEAHRWAIENGLDSGVEFVGPVAPNDVPKWFVGLDAFLHPSLEESFGMVLIEAMAAGIPVIAGASSGAVPIVTGGHAHLIDVSSPTAIADALQDILSNTAVRKTFAEYGLSWSKQFDVQAVAQCFIQELLVVAD